MREPYKTKQALANELESLKQRIRELEHAESDRKRTEEVIQEGENLSESIINSLPGIFYLFDAQGKFLRWNRNFEIVSGYSHKEILERHPSDFFTGKEKEMVQQTIRDTFVNGEANVEARFVSRNGEGAPYFFTGVRIEINGQPHLIGMGVDITERKKVENALRESEKQYHELTDFLPISFFEVDTAGSIISFNRTALEVFRYKEEDYREGMNALQFFASEEWQRVGEHMGKVIQGTSIPGQEFTFLRKDGSKFIGLIYASPNIHQNNTIGIRGAIIDITKRKLAEEALRESEEKFRLLIENAPDAIYVHADAKFIYLNHTAVNLFGAETADQLLGSSITDRFHPDYHEIIAGRLDDLYGGRKKLSVIEQVYLRLDGSSVPVEAHAIPITYNGKNAALTFVSDITERKRAKEALENERNLLRNLIDNVPDRIYAKDSKGRFIICNEAMIRRMGKTSMTELVGKSDFDLLPLEMAQRFHADEQAIIQSGIPMIDREEPLATEGGKITRWNLATKVPLLDKQGKRIGIVGVGREITDRKQAEEALRCNREIAERLAKETAIMAEIGRVISSTLDIAEVYERFAAEALKLILFDSLIVNLKKPWEDTLDVAYASGADIPERRKGDSFPLKGSVSEFVMRTRTGLIVRSADILKKTDRFSTLGVNLQAGLQSMMSAPLISQNEAIGALVFRAEKQNAYKEQDLLLAERIGAQIAGEIANAQLYTSLKTMDQELKESEQRYRELSMVDDLTQLYNSRHFYVQIKSEIERSNRYRQPLTLLLLDLDNFKAFNDAYGHVEGDQVLLRLGQVMKRCLRETDSAYRYGGEEFTILLPMTTSGDGVITAERIRTEFRKEIFPPMSGQEVHVTVSIGLGQYKTKEEMKAFVHRVDQLMYQGKKNGKDRVCSEP